MKWDIIKKAFRLSLNINLTSTKLMAWAIFIFMTVYFKDVPNEARAYFAISIIGLIVILYTGKNIQDIYITKLKK